VLPGAVNNALNQAVAAYLGSAMGVTALFLVAQTILAADTPKIFAEAKRRF